MISEQDLKEIYLQGVDIRKDVKLSDFTTFGFGGEVPYMFFPKTLNAFEYLAKFLHWNEIDFRVIGFGSNLIVAQKKFKFVVINTSLLSWREIQKGWIVWIWPGTSLSWLIYNLAYEGLWWASELAGIPGTIWGAVYMNAGAYGKEIKDIFVKALILDLSRGTIEYYFGEQMEFDYRKSVLQKNKDLLLLWVYLQFDQVETNEVLNQIKDFNSKRWDKQPLLANTAGSIFKRPKPDFYVGTTLEKLGFKWYGQWVKISSKHAGFLENHWGSWENFSKLIDKIKKKVKEQFGEDLEIEPEIWE